MYKDIDSVYLLVYNILILLSIKFLYNYDTATLCTIPRGPKCKYRSTRYFRFSLHQHSKCGFVQNKPLAPYSRRHDGFPI